MTLNQISKEVRIFENNRASLVKEAKGKYVLVYKEDIIDIYDTEEVAVREGYTKFGNVPFLVKEILEEDRIATIGSINA